MEARVLSLDDVLRERQRWCVPVYQRHYAWDTGENKQLTRLWEDIEEKANELLSATQPYPHYIGAIIVAEPPNQQFGTVRQRLLVDGQQRITTFELVLTAIREAARKQKLSDLIPVIDSYLYNEISGGMSRPDVEKYKLWPSSFDRTLFRNIVDNSAEKLPKLYPEAFYKNGNMKWGAAPLLLAAFWFMNERINTFISATDDETADFTKRLNAVLKGFLSAFRVVMIQLDDKDDAQEIFASLNDLGKPLTALDLIRNDVFYRARRAGEDDEAIFDGHWKTFEDVFWEEMTRQGRFKKPRIEFFLGHFLAAETGKEVNLGKLAAQYHDYARKQEFSTVAEEISHIVQYVPSYRALVKPGDPHIADDIARFFRVWDLTTFHPLVLFTCVASIEDEEKVRIFESIESYVVRRDLCGLPSKNYNNFVIRCLQRLRQKGVSAENLAALFSETDGDSVRMPSDAEVIQKASQGKLYDVLPTPRIRYILENIEHEKRTKFDESVLATSPLTVEHVMPQKWAENWPLPDGRQAPTESSIVAMIIHKVDKVMQEQIATREQLLDSIGNLTLVTGSLNPSMGHAEFKEKKGALSKSLLILNREIGEQPVWNEEVIRRRGADMAKIAIDIWRP